MKSDPNWVCALEDVAFSKVLTMLRRAKKGLFYSYHVVVVAESQERDNQEFPESSPLLVVGHGAQTLGFCKGSS